MIYSYYYISPTALADKQGVNTVFIHERDGMKVYITNHPRIDAELIGQWYVDTGVAVSVDAEKYNRYVKPFVNDGVITDDEGNVIATQTATGIKDSPKYHGQAQRNLQAGNPIDTTGDPRYPDSAQPFVATMERFEELSGAWPGWYWTFIIEFTDPNRAPNARAVGIYDENWNYLYTTGKLTLHDFPGPPDEEGNPTVVQKYSTVCPPGRQTASPENIYYGLLFGADIEGKMILQANNNSQKNFFWEK